MPYACPLRILKNHYSGQIKCIYIDPPYNTGKDFVYKDNFAKDTKDELLESGQKDENNQRLFVNPETAGRYHSNWLTMIYPRLKLARNLLKEDGILIEDDYWWDALAQEHFRPKISIDSFIAIYKSQIEVLYKGRQVILRKKKKSEFELPKSNPFIQLVKNIQKYKQEKNNLVLQSKKKETLNFNVEFSKNIDSFQYLYSNKSELNKIKNMSTIKYKENINILDNLFMYNFFHKTMINTFSDFYKSIIDKNSDLIDNIKLLYLIKNGIITK
jgi:adenine specific DNA methylase Mod